MTSEAKLGRNSRHILTGTLIATQTFKQKERFDFVPQLTGKTLDLKKFFQGLEIPVILAVLDYALRKLRSHQRNSGQFIGRRLVDIDSLAHQLFIIGSAESRKPETEKHDNSKYQADLAPNTTS